MRIFVVAKEGTVLCKTNKLIHTSHEQRSRHKDPVHELPTLNSE